VVVVVQNYNPNIQETEARGSQVQGQPELHNEILSQKIKGWGSSSSEVEHLPSMH
jgi:hypothetical protein